MNRLQSELHRLYLLPAPDPGGIPAGGLLIDGCGRVRAMVMELTGPADWDVLSRVWRGVQTDLELPAPAIAVSGTDGLQLWFSLLEPVSASRAAGFLALLQSRFLVGIAPARLRLLPSATEPPRHAPLVPAPQESAGNWSAFVAPDLAPVFADTPWLDVEPGIDGQADLLARLQGIKPAALDAAMRYLQPAPSSSAAVGPRGRDPASDAPAVDPRRFLQQVLNDEMVALALRIEAAKALLLSRQDD